MTLASHPVLAEHRCLAASGLQVPFSLSLCLLFVVCDSLGWALLVALQRSSALRNGFRIFAKFSSRSILLLLRAVVCSGKLTGRNGRC